MPVDDETKQQLLEARKAIIAQLDELEVRWKGGQTGRWELRGPQDAGDIYDQLREELREINRLLDLDNSDEA